MTRAVASQLPFLRCLSMESVSFPYSCSKAKTGHLVKSASRPVLISIPVWESAQGEGKEGNVYSSSMAGRLK